MQTINEIVSILKSKRNKLVTDYHIHSIGVFGSYARGEQNANSDLDILVEFKQPVGLAFIDLANELEKDLNVKVDLVSRKSISKKLWAYIAPEVIYA